MNHKLHVLHSSQAWEEKQLAWEQKKAAHAETAPLKTPKSLPKMEGITRKTARFLRWKSLVYLLAHDRKKIFLRYFFKRPLRYGLELLKSYSRKESYVREEDFFCYGIRTEEEFARLLDDKKNPLLIGFSYCHKPFECPSGRFTDACQNDPESPVCGQCFIGECTTLLQGTPAKIVCIPTVHHIGEKLFETVFENPGRTPVFLITACEMSLRMFGDWGNMVGAKGIGVRLDGRICNTMRAFKLSEEGIKPGLTVVLDPTRKKMLSLLARFHTNASSEKA